MMAALNNQESDAAAINEAKSEAAAINEAKSDVAATNEAKSDAAAINEAKSDVTTAEEASAVVVYDAQTEAHASFMARRIGGLLPTSMRYLDRFLGWDCAPTLLAQKFFGSTSRAQEVSESVAMLQAIEQHVPHLSIKSERVTCVVVGDGTKPRTAAVMAMNTRWQTFLSIDPAMENAPTNEFVAHGSIHRVWIAAAKIQDITINITDDTEHVVVMLPHCHVVPDEALRSLNFQGPTAVNKSTGVNATDKATADCPSGSTDLAATTAALSLADIRVVVVQMPCCRYVWHDTVAGAPPDVTYEYSAQYLFQCFTGIASLINHVDVLGTKTRVLPAHAAQCVYGTMQSSGSVFINNTNNDKYAPIRSHTQSA
jgi:hypothetical protein